MKLSLFQKSVIVGMSLAMTGCMSTPGGITDASIPLEQGRYTVIGDQVDGVDRQVVVFGYGISKVGSPQHRAYRQALEKAPGADGLITLGVNTEMLNLFVLQVITSRVTGTPVKVNK